MKLTKKIALCVVSACLMTSAAVTQAAPKDGKNYRIAYIARAQGDSFAAWLADSVVKTVKKYPDTTGHRVRRPEQERTDRVAH